MPLFLTRRRLLGSAAAAAAAATLLPGSARLWANEGAARRYHALLVAVTAYPNLPPNNALTGPNNDARLLREYLLDGAPVPFDPEDVTLLADELDGAADVPTLAAIRGAMADLARRAGPEDFVYLHFSGHGHQQPARDPENEIDGLDEVFMPRDVEIMTREERAWPNGYVDKDIKADIDAIRATGAFVWAVFDCCHSGTITRNVAQAPNGEVARKIDLADMDIPEDVWAGTRRSLGGTPRQAMLSESTAGADPSQSIGGLAAFYASQTIEPTYELPLPSDSENPTQMGLFTFTVLSRLAENPALTYRQLGEAVMHSYAGMNRTKPIPMFEGDLDSAVFAAGDLGYVPQWPLRDGPDGPEIAAGHLHRLSPGARLAVLPGPAATLDAALGIVQIGTAEAMRSTIAPVPPGDGAATAERPAIDPAAIPAGAWLRVVEQVVPMELAVALPSGSDAHGPEATRIAEMLRNLSADDSAPFRLRLVEPDAPADIRFDVLSPAGVAEMMRAQEEPENIDEGLLARNLGDQSPRLWLMDASAAMSLRTGATPPSLDLAANDPEAQAEWLRDTLTMAYRATNLARLAGTDSLSGSDVSVELYLKRADPEGGAAEQVLRTSEVPFARPGDEVHLRVVNNSSRPVDVHALFVGSDFAIVPAANPERLHPGNRMDRGLFGIAENSFGRERVVVAMSEAAPLSPVMNLSFLAQDGVATRGAGGSGGVAAGLRELIRDVAEAPATRSAVALGAEPEAPRDALMVYSLDVAPRS